MKSLIVVLLHWAIMLCGFGVLCGIFGGSILSFLTGVLLLVPLYFVYRLRSRLKEEWCVPNSAFEVEWDKSRRRREIDDNKTLSSQDKGKLKRAIDDEKHPIDWLSTVLCDPIYVIIMILAVVRMWHRIFK